MIRSSRLALPIVAACAIFALVVPAAHGAIQAVSKHKGDYLPAHNFKIEIDGVIAGGFKSVGGLESETEVVEFQNGGDLIVRKVPHAEIVLTRYVMDGGDDIRAWYQKTLTGPVDRKSGSIIYLDRAGQEVLRYNFFEAWPCKWSVPELDSTKNETAIEKIEICVEKVERA